MMTYFVTFTFGLQTTTVFERGLETTTSLNVITDLKILHKFTYHYSSYYTIKEAQFKQILYPLWKERKKKKGKIYKNKTIFNIKKKAFLIMKNKSNTSI